LSFAKSLYRRFFHGAIRSLNRLGWNLTRISDYYSPLPVRGELERHQDRWNRPSELVGLNFDLEAMKGLLGEILGRYGEEYGNLPSYQESKALGYGPGFTEVDSRVVYSMIRHLKPRRYLEIGSGLSTYYAWQAARRNEAEGAPCELRAIDPYASEKVKGIPGLEILLEPVQEVNFEVFEGLDAGDVLFIDSTHVVKIDGDVPFLYLEAVPRLKPGVWVHAHDIHFPYNVPFPAEQYLFRAKWPMYWTETMLLQAFLSFNRQFEIALSAPLIRYHDEAFLRANIPAYRPTVPEDYDTHFGSIWLRRLGD